MQRRFVPKVSSLEDRIALDGDDSSYDPSVDAGYQAALLGSSFTGGSWSDPSVDAQRIIDEYTERIMNDSFEWRPPTQIPGPIDPY